MPIFLYAWRFGGGHKVCWGKAKVTCLFERSAWTYSKNKEHRHTPQSRPSDLKACWCHWLQGTFIVLLSIWQPFSSSFMTAGCHGTCCGAWCQIIVVVDWWHHRFNLHLRSEAKWRSEHFETKSWGVTSVIQRYQSDPILSSGLIPSHLY